MSTYLIGVSPSGASTTSLGPCTRKAAKPLTANQPVFVVVKVTEVPGVRNDTTELFLFTTEAVPATEPGSADAVSEYTVGGSVSGDIAVSNSGNGIVAFALRQFQNINWPGNLRVDELRLGTTWESVISDPATSVGEWTFYH